MAPMNNDLKNFHKNGTKVVCSGFNYYKLIKSVDYPKPDEPVIFCKTMNSIITEGTNICIPKGYDNVVQEVELGVVIGKEARNLKKEEVMDHIGGYCVALDMTELDLLTKAMNKVPGLPFIRAKSFDTACPVSRFIEKDELDSYHCELHCSINGKEVQRSGTDDMIFDIPTLIADITSWMTLHPGDLVLTGTPAGITTQREGDLIEIGVKNLKTGKEVTSAKFLVTKQK